jgi:hypothetical protein
MVSTLTLIIEKAAALTAKLCLPVPESLCTDASGKFQGNDVTIKGIGLRN